MELLKIVFGKLGAGILYGVGFFLGIAIISYISMPYFEEKMEESLDESFSSAFAEYDETAKLDVEVISERINSQEFTILGKLVNRGEGTWLGVSLKAELYNESGVFIEECTKYIQQVSKPGSEINFKLSCGSQCSSLQFDQYASYKLLIVDAHQE